MMSIVNDQKMSEGEKVLEYNRALAQFQSIPQDRPNVPLTKEMTPPMQAKQQDVASKYEPTIGISD